MQTPEEMRAVAELAEAENASGVIAGQEGDQRYLDGVTEALRWATGEPASEEFAGLLDRLAKVRAGGDMPTPAEPSKPSRGDVLAKLEKVLGRKLREGEAERITDAVEGVISELKDTGDGGSKPSRGDVLASILDLDKMSDEALAELTSRLTEVRCSRLEHQLVELLKKEVTEGGDVLEGPDAVVTVVFYAMDFDNGWFFSWASVSSCTFGNGKSYDRFELQDKDGKINTVLADLSSYYAVGAAATLTVNLATGDVEFDAYGRN